MDAHSSSRSCHTRQNALSTLERDHQDHTAWGLRPSRVGFVCISDSEPDHRGASMTALTTTLATRQLQIEFLFLDLDTCTRCRATDTTLLEAIERTRPALDAAGVTVAVTKTLVAGEAQARQLGFVSSPTIRINGVDIAGELVESTCDTCSEACACEGTIDCRDWIWRGERSTEPPVGLIVEAIMGQAFGTEAAVAFPPPPTMEIPENLSRFFASKTANEASTQVTNCCEPAEQADCCEAAAKESCCAAAA